MADRIEQSSEQRRRWSAYHEAGHAVVGTHFGFEHHFLRVDPGAVDGDASHYGHPDDNYADYVVMLAAGGVAAARFWKAQTGESIPPFDADEDDWQTIKSIAREHLNIDTSDEVQWWDFQQGLIAQTLEIVGRPELWSEIEAVARELERHGWTLSGDALKAMLAAVPRQGGS